MLILINMPMSYKRMIKSNLYKYYRKDEQYFKNVKINRNGLNDQIQLNIETGKPGIWLVILVAVLRLY
jgi:hypothetical protein